mgnify:FL=1
MIKFDAGLAAGTEVARLAKIASLDPAKPAGGNQMHSDEFAQRMGFKGALMPAPTLMAYVTELLISVYGEAWFDDGSLKLRFRRPIYNQEQILVKAQFKEMKEEAVSSSVILDVTLEKSDGEVAVIGEANCSVAVP